MKRLLGFPWQFLLALCCLLAFSARASIPHASLTVNLPATVTMQYDLNGNLTSDGTPSFVYDAENQLTNVNVAGQWKTEFVYDGAGRKRIAKDYNWQAGAWNQTNEIRYIYDGMLVIQERNSSNTPQVTYTRGLDLSGGFQGAGGIGGLLARTDGNGSAFYHADGSGNITALMDANQNITARYLYDSFGKPLGQWGSMASANRYRFSSKEVHPNSGLSYYGFRFYEPNFQRWLNHDPIGEVGGINLYGFVGNSPIGWIDNSGLEIYPANFIGPIPPGSFRSGEDPGWRSWFALGLSGVGKGSDVQFYSKPMTSTDLARAEQTGLQDIEELKHAPLEAMLYIPFGAEETAIKASGGLMTGFVKKCKFGSLGKAAETQLAVAKDVAFANRSQLAAAINPEQKILLRKLFGTGPENAIKALENFRAGGKIPEGLTRETLETYRKLAITVIDAGHDGIGAQAERLKLIDAILEKL